MKYGVYGDATVVCSMAVEAGNEEEAIEIANDEFRCIFPDTEVEFDDAERIVRT